MKKFLLFVMLKSALYCDNVESWKEGRARSIPVTLPVFPKENQKFYSKNCLFLSLIEKVSKLCNLNVRMAKVQNTNTYIKFCFCFWSSEAKKSNFNLSSFLYPGQRKNTEPIL